MSVINLPNMQVQRLKGNQQDTVSGQGKPECTRANTAMRAQMQCIRHSPSFHTQSGDWNEMHLACNEGKQGFIRCARLGMRLACEVLESRVSCVWWGVTCWWRQVAALPPRSSSAARPLDGPQDESLRLQCHVAVAYTGPR
jgi:hypothetical protein